jgi:hypothetical protein
MSALGLFIIERRPGQTSCSVTSEEGSANECDFPKNVVTTLPRKQTQQIRNEARLAVHQQKTLSAILSERKKVQR